MEVPSSLDLMRGTLHQELNVNHNYEYEDNDIKVLLELKVTQLAETSHTVRVLGALNNVFLDQIKTSIKSFLSELRKSTDLSSSYQLLIPYNLGNYHWVGIFIELTAGLNLTKIIWCDPLKHKTENILAHEKESIQQIKPNEDYKLVEEQLKKIWPIAKIQTMDLLKQSDSTSCGAVTIENLIALALNNIENKILSKDEIQTIRRQHLELVREKKFNYFEKFYPRQRGNLPSVANLPEQIKLLSQEIKFSPHALKRIMECYQLILKIETAKITQIIKKCLKDNEAYQGDVRAYLHQVRQGINQILSCSLSENDKQCIDKLINLFFGFEPGSVDLKDISDCAFRVGHEELRAIDKLLCGENIDYKEVFKSIEEQIKEDEIFAKKLLAEDQAHYIRAVSAVTVQVPIFLTQQESQLSAFENKDKLVELLFKGILKKISETNLSAISPRIFLIYAHDNHKYSNKKADADIAKTIITWLHKELGLNLYSDETPYGGHKHPNIVNEIQLKTDILKSQLCLLPKIENCVDVIILCGSELLKTFSELEIYKKYFSALNNALSRGKLGAEYASVQRVVTRHAAKPGFHHVLTELVFLNIRVLDEGQYTLIPIMLNGNNFTEAFPHFIVGTDVYIEDTKWREHKIWQGKEVFKNQGLYVGFFKLLERLFVANANVQQIIQTYKQKFNDGITAIRENEITPDTIESWIGKLHQDKKEKREKHALDTAGLIETGLIESMASKPAAERKESKKKQKSDTSRGLNSNLPSLNKVNKGKKELESDTNGIHKKQGRFELREKQFDSVYDKAKQILYNKYEEQCKISYLFYDHHQSIPIEQVPRLALVINSTQQEKENKALHSLSLDHQRYVTHEDIYEQKEHIQLENIFEHQKNDTELLTRLLILGRAGIGKTTLCKFIIYQSIHNNLWKSKFDWVFWIPLRNLATQDYQVLKDLNKSKLIAQIIWMECFQCDSKITSEQIEKWLIQDSPSKILLLLDGYDEVAHLHNATSHMGRLLDVLLQYDNVILTSRPYVIHQRLQSYRKFENIGFLKEDIKDYVNKFFSYIDKPEYADVLVNLLQSNTAIWGAAHIPIILELICCLWNDNYTKQQDYKPPLSMTELYEEIIYKLAKRYLIKRTKEPILEQDLNYLSKEQIMEHCKDVFSFLEELALAGLINKNGLLLISKLIIEKVRLKFSHKNPMVFKDVLEAGFIKGTGYQKHSADQDYYFVHLSLQEFFAARYFIRLDKPLFMKLVQQYAIDNRYEIVFLFVAGLLKNRQNNLEFFFEVLDGEPKDLIMLSRQMLILRCMDECRLNVSDVKKEKFNQDLNQWIDLALKKEYAFKTLFTYLSLCSYVFNQQWLINKFVTLLRNSDSTFRQIVYYALTKSNNLPIAILDEFVSALPQICWYPHPAIDNLKNHFHLPVAILKKLVCFLEFSELLCSNETFAATRNAIDILASQSALPDEIDEMLVNMYKTGNARTQSNVQDLLSKIELVKSTKITQLITQQKRLEEDDLPMDDLVSSPSSLLGMENVESEKDDSLNDEKFLSSLEESLSRSNSSAAGNYFLQSENILRLESALESPVTGIRLKAARILRELDNLSVTTLSKLVLCIGDKDSWLRNAAADAISNQSNLPPIILNQLTLLLQGKNVEAKCNAALSLKNLSNMPLDIRSCLVELLDDSNFQVRRNVAGALGCQNDLPIEILTKLVMLLKDKDPNVEMAAVYTLKKQSSLPLQIIEQSITILEQNRNVGLSVSSVISGCADLPFELLTRIGHIIGQYQKDSRTQSLLLKGQSITHIITIINNTDKRFIGSDFLNVLIYKLLSEKTPMYSSLDDKNAIVVGRFDKIIFTNEEKKLAFIKFFNEFFTQYTEIKSKDKDNSYEYNDTQNEIKRWHIPEPNLCIVERNIISEIAKNFKEKQFSISKQVLVGLGGVGKTALAASYCYYAINDGVYNEIAWFNAETDLAGEFRHFAKDYFNLPVDELKELDLVKAIYSQFYKRKKYLLIFDNVESNIEFIKYLPSSNNQRFFDILITSRNQSWNDEFKLINLGVFSKDEAVAYIQKTLSTCHQYRESESNNLAEVLGCLPLALKQATAYIRATGITIKSYIENFNNNKDSKEKLLSYLPEHYIASNSSENHYRLLVMTTWDKSIFKISSESPHALEILKLCAFLSPECISRILLQKLMISASTKADNLDIAIALIHQYSLVEFGYNGGLQIHRLVQEIIKLQLFSDNNILHNKIKNVLKYITEFDRDQADKGLLDNLNIREDLIPHYKYILAWLLQYKVIDNESISLCYEKLSDIYYDLHYTSLSYPYYEKALEWYLKSENRRPERIAYLTFVLARSQRGNNLSDKAENNYKQALKYYNDLSNTYMLTRIYNYFSKHYCYQDNKNKALEMAENAEKNLKMLMANNENDNQMKILKSENYLAKGNALFVNNNYIDAEKYVNQAIDIRKEFNLFRELATSYKMLSLIQEKLKKWDEAVLSLEEAKRYRIKCFGEKRGFTLVIIRNIGDLYKCKYNETKNVSDKKLCIENYMSALNIVKDQATHITFQVYRDIGHAHLWFNELLEAKHYVEKALEIRLLLCQEENSIKDETDIATQKISLGEILIGLNECEKAFLLLHQGLKTRLLYQTTIIDRPLRLLYKIYTNDEHISSTIKTFKNYLEINGIDNVELEKHASVIKKIENENKNKERESSKQQTNPQVDESDQKESKFVNSTIPSAIKNSTMQFTNSLCLQQEVKDIDDKSSSTAQTVAQSLDIYNPASSLNEQIQIDKNQQQEFKESITNKSTESRSSNPFLSPAVNMSQIGLFPLPKQLIRNPDTHVAVSSTKSSCRMEPVD